jgi:hypothetical protein
MLREGAPASTERKYCIGTPVPVDVRRLGLAMSRLTAETDCVPGVVGLELRNARTSQAVNSCCASSLAPKVVTMIAQGRDAVGTPRLT